MRPSAIWFAHCVAADERSVRKTGQILFLLCFGAVVNERNDGRPHVGVDGEKQAVILAGVAQIDRSWRRFRRDRRSSGL